MPAVNVQKINSVIPVKIRQFLDKRADKSGISLSKVIENIFIEFFNNPEEWAIPADNVMLYDSWEQTPCPFNVNKSIFNKIDYYARSHKRSIKGQSEYVIYSFYYKNI
jgi:hypothetical protein